MTQVENATQEYEEHVETAQVVEGAAAQGEEAAAAEATWNSLRGGVKPSEDKAASADPGATQAGEDEAQKKAREKAEAEQAEERRKAAEQAWWDAAPKGVRETMELVTALQGRVRNVEGHIGGLTSVTKELKSAFASAKTATEKAGGDAPSAEQIAAIGKDSAKWKQMQEDFPEWAEAVGEQLAALSARPAGIPDPQEFEKKIQQQIRTAEESARQLARIDLQHDGWEKTVKTPEFATWLESQPDEIRALAGSTKAKDAISLLDAFVAASKQKSPPAADVPAKPDIKARLETAVPATTGRSVSKAEPVTEAEAAAAAFRRLRSG